MRKVELKPIKERPEDFDAIQARIDQVFRKYLYEPLFRDLIPGQKEVLLNALESEIVKALRSGKIYFYRGEFIGKFYSGVSRELKKLGAEWSKQNGSFKIPKNKLSPEVVRAIDGSDASFQQTANRIDSVLQSLVPDEIAEKLSTEKLFDSTLWKTNREFEETLKGITVAPKLTDFQRESIAKDYTNNLKKHIKGWTEEEIVKLRGQVQESVMKGTRYEGLVKTLQDSYGSSLSKAKFLARQETSLMMTQFKQSRYQESGSEEYVWQCVVGTKNHPVRPMHKALNGKTFRWDQPPITAKNGARNNPGQDYNCRCFARPVIKF